MMRVISIAAALPLLALAACGGAGPESAGSVAAPPAGNTGGGGTGGGVTPAPTPTPSTGTGGTGGGVTPSPTPTPSAPATFLTVTTATDFAAIGSAHALTYSYDANGNQGTLYQGNASTVKTPSGTVNYSPRDGVFTLTIKDDKAGVDRTARFQDPAHRSDFDAESTPSLEAPNLVGFNYLIAGNSRETTTFFYQRPDSTLYVTLGGFTHTSTDDQQRITKREHGALVFGALTPQTQVPIRGTGTYTGGFLATAQLNATFDSGNTAPDYMQWISGTSRIDVDFTRSTVALGLTGAVGPTFEDGVRVADASLAYPSGTAFSATGSATIDLIRSGGFVGGFTSATLGGVTIDFRGVSAGSSTAGASSIDGAFFGPNAVNVGGNFRIIGGVPDQRIDIQGAFTGAQR